MRHRLMIVGSSIEFLDLIRLAKSRGYETIVCDGYPDGPAKKEADKTYDIDVTDVAAVAAVCRAEQVDGIIGSFSDLLFEQITQIAHEAGLRWYATPEMLPYYREKNRAKALLKELGIRVPKNRLLSPGFSDEDLEGMRFPLVVKPVNGYGSKGIFVVETPEDLRVRFDRVTQFSRIKDVQVEEYSPGREYNFMTWLVDGELTVLSLADREKNPREEDRVPVINRLAYPARHMEEIVDKAADVLRKFAARTGQKDGPLVMQFFFHDGEVEVCEIAGRIFGHEHGLVTLCSGLNFEALLLDYVYDPPAVRAALANHSPYFTRCAAGLYCMGENGKTVKSLAEVNRLAEAEEVVQTVSFYEEGDTIRDGGRKPYLLRWYIKAADREELDRITQRIFREICVPAEDGTNLVRPMTMPDPDWR